MAEHIVPPSDDFPPPLDEGSCGPGAALNSGPGAPVSWRADQSERTLTREDLSEELGRHCDDLSKAIRKIFREELERLDQSLVAAHGSVSRSSWGGSAVGAVNSPTSARSVPSSGNTRLDDSNRLGLVSRFQNSSQVGSGSFLNASSGGSPRPQTRLRIKFQQTSQVIKENDAPQSFQKMSSQVRGIRERAVHYVERKGWQKTLLHALDLLILFLINVNAIVIAIQVEHAAREDWGELPPSYSHLEYTFCAIYTIELMVRICIKRWSFFLLKTNVFDAMVVVGQITEIIMSLLQPAFSWKSLSLMRFFRFLRALRVLRAVNSSEMLDLVYLLNSSLTSFLWTGVLIVLLTFVVAVWLTEEAADTRFYKIDTLDCGEQMELVDRYWGSIRLSWWTLFMSLFGGIDWQHAAEALPRDLPTVIFVGYIAFMSLVILNLVTGVFVTTANKKIDRDKQRDINRSLDTALYDANLNWKGPIDLETFKALLDHKGMKLFLREHNVGREHVLNVFELLQDNNGPLSPQDFIAFMSRLEGFSNSLTLAQMHLSGSVDRLEMKQEMQQAIADLHELVTQLGFELLGCKNCEASKQSVQSSRESAVSQSSRQSAAFHLEASLASRLGYSKKEAL